MGGLCATRKWYPLLLRILLDGPSVLATPIAKEPGKCGVARNPEGGETAFGGQVALQPPDTPAFFPRGEKSHAPSRGRRPSSSPKLSAMCSLMLRPDVHPADRAGTPLPAPHPTPAAGPTLPSELSREALSTDHFAPAAGVSTGLSPAASECRLALASWERRGKAAGLASGHPRPVLPSVLPQRGKSVTIPSSPRPFHRHP